MPKTQRKQRILDSKRNKEKIERRMKCYSDERNRLHCLFEKYCSTSDKNQNIIKFKSILESDDSSFSPEDIQLKDHNGNTLLHIAALFSNRVSLFQSLIDHGADINIMNNKGMYPYECYFNQKSGKKSEILSLLHGPPRKIPYIRYPTYRDEIYIMFLDN